jgi:flagellar hook-length control protein FliK
MKLPAAPLPERPAVELLGALLQLGAPPPDELFAALLTTQTARTAPAEGQTGDTPKDTPAQPVPAGAPPADMVALIANLPLPAPAQPVQVQPKPDEPKPEAIAPKAAPTVAAPPVVADVAPKEAAPAPKQGEPAHKDTAPAAPKKSADEPVPATKGSDAFVAPAAVKETGPRPTVHAHSTSVPRPVLHAERVEALVRLATRHGAAEARMELHPQELGSVVVKLRVTSDGLQATFTASNPDAVSQLQQAGEDLRRTLEAKGVTLASLEVRAQSEEARDRREQRPWGRTKDRRAAEPIDDEPLTVTTSIPVGELVDVQA